MSAEYNDLKVQHEVAMARLQEVGTRWLVAHTSRQPTAHIEAALHQTERETRRIERRMRRLQKTNRAS